MNSLALPNFGQSRRIEGNPGSDFGGLGRSSGAGSGCGEGVWVCKRVQLGRPGGRPAGSGCRARIEVRGALGLWDFPAWGAGRGVQDALDGIRKLCLRVSEKEGDLPDLGVGEDAGVGGHALGGGADGDLREEV